jgi:hypothetical protein
VPWFRRGDETLNDQLLREAGYSPEGMPTDAHETDESREAEPELQPDPTAAVVRERPDVPVFGSAGSLGPRDAHVVATTEAPKLKGDSYEFTTLPDGSMIVDDSCDEDLSRLADAVEEHLKRPYRASATRHDDDVWVISARPIEVARLAADGDELDLTLLAGERTYTVDGRNVDEALAPARLAAFGKARSADYAVHAIRIDADLWEIDADPL